MARSLTISATEPQAAFHALTSKFSLFVAGFGAGKTQTLANQAIIDASAGPDAIIGLYAPTYSLLSTVVAPRILAALTDLGIPFKYNKTEHLISTLHPQFGSFILRSLDQPELIVGYETYCAHIDELDTLPTAKAEEVWNKVIARNRQQLKHKKGQQNRVSAYSTPEGFKFLYSRWISKPTKDYKYIQAKTESNPFLPPDYIQGLRETYPDELINAYLNGEFVNLTSGTVYSNFDRILHNSTETIREGEPLYIGMDFNVTNMAATIYVRRDGGCQWHAVDEIVGAYDTPEMIGIIKTRYFTSQVIVYPDASGASRKTVDASTSDIALLTGAGFEVRAHPKNPAVKDRILAVNTALSKGLLYINTTRCKQVASCLEQQSYDKNGEPDKKSGSDHQNDASGYPIAYELPVRKPLINIDINWSS